MWRSVERESNGRLSVSIFPNSALGNDTSMISQVRSGALEFMNISGPILSQVVPVAGIESVPFAYTSAADAYRSADGALGSYVRQQITAIGLHALANPFESGFVQITNSVRPIANADDLNGLKMRTGPSRIAVDTFKSLGANATPMNLAEVYTALQTHLIDGQYNPYVTIEVQRFFEIQKYVAEVNLFWGNYWCISSAATWGSLAPDLQTIIQRNATKYSVLQRRDQELLSIASADKLQRQGMVRSVPSLASFRAKLGSSGFYTRWKAEFGSRAWSLLEETSGKLEGP